MRQNSEIISQDRVKDVLITRTAIKSLKPESVVREVVNFQFKDALKAIKQYDQVEFAKFGKLLRSWPKVRRKLKGMTALVLMLEAKYPEPDKEMQDKIARTKDVIDYLTKKLQDHESGLEGVDGGSKEQAATQEGA